MESTIDFYRKELHRIAWRLQYRMRIQRNRECTLVQEITPSESFTEQTDNRVLVEHIFSLIPTQQEKKIIYDFFIKGKTELEIAKELNISQQAVNKWKRKTLEKLNRILSS